MTVSSPPRPALVQLGILLAIGSYAAYSWGDAIIKGLGQTVGMFEIGLITTLFALIPAIFAKPRTEKWRQSLQLQSPWRMHLIAALRLNSSVMITYSFITIPLAEAYCIVFLIPVFITILSVLVLKEEVGIDRWVLILVSFLGVMLVVRPGFRELELGHLTALGCAISAGFAAVLTRQSAGSESRLSLFLLPTLYAIVFNAAMVLVLGGALPGWRELFLMLLCGLCGGTGYLMQIAAITHSPASRVAPIQYSQIVWALILGALFFAELPDSLSLAGLAVVVIAGVTGIFSDGARARLAGRFAEYRARKSGAQPEPVPIPGPPEI